MNLTKKSWKENCKMTVLKELCDLESEICKDQGIREVSPS